MAIADSRGDESLWASAAANASTIHNIRAEYGTALELAARARGIGEEVGNAFARWHATTLPAANRAVLGDHRLARELMEREISHADLQDAPFRHGPAMSVLGTALSVAGDLAAARECARHAYVGGVLADARRTLDLIDGNWEQLDAIVTAQIDDARAAGEMFTVVEGSIVVGRARALLGDDRGARAAYDEAEEIAAARGATALAALVQPERARVQLVTGELDAARASIVRCRALMNLEEPWCAHPARVDIADASVAAAMGDLARAEYLFRRGLDLLESFALPFDQADAHVEWGRALTRAGREAEAADHFNAALELYTRHGAGERWRERARALRLEPRR
jgi:tetratricopeptide (TPR) repeat protein